VHELRITIDGVPGQYFLVACSQPLDFPDAPRLVTWTTRTIALSVPGRTRWDKHSVKGRYYTPAQYLIYEVREAPKKYLPRGEWVVYPLLRFTPRQRA